jgi:hypothetical protein
LYSLVKKGYNFKHHVNLCSAHSIEVLAVLLEGVYHDLFRELNELLLAFVRHIFVSACSILWAQELVPLIELLILLTVRVILLLEVDTLKHTHISDLLQGHRVNEIVRALVFIGLDATDEMQFAELTGCWPNVAFLLFFVFLVPLQ